VYSNYSNQEVPREVLLGESDLLWPELRHTYSRSHRKRNFGLHRIGIGLLFRRHIAEATKHILKNFNDFVRTSKAIEMRGKSKEATTLKEMAEAMKAMPQYQELLGKARTIHR
jgi:hypothetical protein